MGVCTIIYKVSGAISTAPGQQSVSFITLNCLKYSISLKALNISVLSENFSKFAMPFVPLAK